MGLNENCKSYLNELIAFKPEYGWGWTRLDAPEIRVPAQVNGVPYPFHCRIREFFNFHDELRGFVGRVEEPEHIYNGLLLCLSTRVVGTFNFTDNLPNCDIQLGADEPSGDFPEFVSGSPIVNGFGVIGASLQYIAKRDLKIGFRKSHSSE